MIWGVHNLDSSSSLQYGKVHTNCISLRYLIWYPHLFFCAVCQINTVEGTTCTSADGCTCKPGYAAPDCCKCDAVNDFFEDEDGNCIS